MSEVHFVAVGLDRLEWWVRQIPGPFPDLAGLPQDVLDPFKALLEKLLHRPQQRGY